MKIRADEVGTYLQWLEIFMARVFPFASTLGAEAQPLTTFERISATTPAKARSGLAEAIGDMCALARNLGADDAALLDQQFADAGLPSLRKVQARFDKRVARTLARGSIRSDAEYYLLQAALDSAEEGHERKVIVALLGDYEVKLLT